MQKAPAAPGCRRSADLPSGAWLRGRRPRLAAVITKSFGGLSRDYAVSAKGARPSGRRNARPQRPLQTIRTGTSTHRLVSLKKQSGKFARPIPAARFCGLKAALLSPSPHRHGQTTRAALVRRRSPAPQERWAEWGVPVSWERARQPMPKRATHGSRPAKKTAEASAHHRSPSRWLFVTERQPKNPKIAPTVIRTFMV